MPTPNAILDALHRLYRLIPAATRPAASVLPDLAADWGDLLADVSDAELSAAVAGWLRDPERGKWWPTPADILGQLPRRASADETAWDAILGRLRAGEYVVGDILTTEQQAALADLGGTWRLRNADVAELPRLRARYLGACKDRRGGPALPGPAGNGPNRLQDARGPATATRVLPGR